jgi:hypothetical protein
MSIQQNFPAITPSLSLNFARSKTLDPRITFTRTSSATRVNETGLVEVVPANSPRFDHSYDPVSGTVRSLGLLVEEGRQNLVRNNTAQGAVVGTPGTAPTNSYFFISPSGISREITAIGVENGITYFDVRYYGTSISTGEISWASQVATLTPVTVGQTVSASVYLKVVSGDFTSIGSLSIRVLDYGPGYLRESSTPYSTSLLQSPTLLRYSHTRTTGASTTGVVFSITLHKTASGPVDVTLRIGMPQIEVGSFPTSVIPTFGTAVTRTADNVSMVGENFSSWYNPSEGTVFLDCTPVYNNSTNQYRRLLSIHNNSGSQTDVIQFIQSEQSNQVQCAVWDGASPQSGFVKVVTSGTRYKVAFAVKENNMNASYDGSISTDDTTCTLPIMTEMDIGSYNTFSSTQATMHINKISYYPRRLTNSQLITLTR